MFCYDYSRNFRSKGFALAILTTTAFTSGCSTSEANHSSSSVANENGRDVLHILVELDGELLADDGTIFTAVRGDSRRFSGQFVDHEGNNWTWSPYVGRPSLFSANFPWGVELNLRPNPDAVAPWWRLHRTDDVCLDTCTLRIYYTEQSFRPDGPYITEWSEVADRIRMWDEAPELWRYAEYEYRFSEREEVSFIESFDDATGRGVVQLGLLTMDISGDEPRITMRAYPLPVFDQWHPSFNPQLEDVATYPDQGIDQGPDSGSERR